MRTCFLGVFLLASANSLFSQGHLVTPSEFEVLLGSGWKGNLTYKDYQSGQENTIPVELQVEKIVEGEYRLIFTYPNEPKANSKEKFKIGKNHMTVNKKRIISRDKTKGDLLTFETKELGKDNKKPATIFMRYEIGENTFKIAKQVKFEGDESRTLRNTYSFQRQQISRN